MKQGRLLCWDDSLIETSSQIEIIMHKPQKRNLALVCDDEWEGCHNGYACVMKVGDKYRMYYRASTGRHMMDGSFAGGTTRLCVAESYDGINFIKPVVGKYDYNGTKYNNIVVNHHFDNFSVFYDENPDCPEDERFKALCGGDFKDSTWWLYYYASRDGIDFEKKGYIPVKGTFDTYNVTFWDKETEQYFLYYRSFHQEDGNDFEDMLKISVNTSIRDIRVATSKDFKNWGEHGRIKYAEGQPDMGMYTNQITRYFRSPNAFIGFPTRYADRLADKENFKFMPLGDRHVKVAEKFNREGTAITDSLIMTSFDGFTFNRRDEAFLTPGIEDRNNWWYGDCYIAYGLAETESEEEGAPREISFYVGENYRIKNVNFRRFTVRLDGFFSWYAKNSGGEVLTKPVVVEGETLRINFSSSVAGGVNISLCDETGNEIDGYKSYTVFGDSTDRPVEFEKRLADIQGKSVRLKIRLQDAHLYSFIFE